MSSQHDISDNPFLRVLDPFESQRKQQQQVKDEMIEFQRLCFETFHMFKDGKSLYDLIKERYLLRALLYLAEGIPGQGSRPDYLDDKFSNLAEQAKAYKEVRKALGAQTGAPESYDFGEYKDILDLNNDHLKDYLNYARENRLSQDAFSRT